jgi:hypothetical protein
MSRFQNASTDGLVCALVNEPIISHVRQAENCQVQNYYKGKCFRRKIVVGKSSETCRNRVKTEFGGGRFSTMSETHFLKFRNKSGEQPISGFVSEYRRQVGLLLYSTARPALR